MVVGLVGLFATGATHIFSKTVYTRFSLGPASQPAFSVLLCGALGLLGAYSGVVDPVVGSHISLYSGIAGIANWELVIKNFLKKT